MINKKKSKGFTIVELLVVIVVIGILAAITIVSYSGVTSKARTAQAQSNANSARQVAEIIYTDTGSYPATLAAFATGTSTTKLTGITVLAGAATLDASNGQTSISWECTDGCVNPTGGRIQYYNFTTPGKVAIYVGSATSTSGFTSPTS